MAIAKYKDLKCKKCGKKYTVNLWRMKCYEDRGQKDNFCSQQCNGAYKVERTAILRKARKRRDNLRSRKIIGRCRDCNSGMWKDGTGKCYSCRKGLK